MDRIAQPSEGSSRGKAWFPQLSRELWILAAGQFLLFLGQGFTLVYASIYFVNQLGFSATQVGLALSSSGFAGIVGRFLAGNALDAPRLGRRGTLLLAAMLSGIAGFCLAFADTFGLLIAGNVLMGLGISLYWPATLAMTTDLTTTENRTEAFALTRLADNLGLGVGALLAGQYIALSGNYRTLFMGKGVLYLCFGLVIYWAIAETRQTQTTPRQLVRNWWQALNDRVFLTYLIANIFFTTYAAQLNSTLPLYLANFVPGGNTDTGFSEQLISYLFFWNAFLKIVLQLPLLRWLRQLAHVNILLIALVLWTGGFLFIWITGMVPAHALGSAYATFALIAIAEILYAPSAVALVGEIAPQDLRGIYFSLESECWAIGFLIGPAMGGWALDHPTQMGSNFWLLLLGSTVVAGSILLILRQRLPQGFPGTLENRDTYLEVKDEVESGI
ncbi:MAG: MFS transporter [Synechococcaceae cyanobacterium SM2_3_1]|nr:MFS transporter [Synechococcaceae cyanobacterium SM2_3_1]